MLLALVGNQNCGKTTLFNQLTGSNQHVGNFPGVTIEHKIGQIIGWKNYDLVDLPGIYSIRPYSGEEKVSRDFIIERKPDAIINIVDATNIERNLYLTLQLIEMGKPMVLALNNTAKIILKDHIEHCIVDAVASNDEEAINDLNKAIERFME